MQKSSLFLCAAIGATFGITGAASASFVGQTILGPLGPGSMLAGDNTGSTNDNDGWFSGGPVFDIWDGGDDVYALNWPGGTLTVDLLYDPFLSEPDLFLYTSITDDESDLDSIGGTGLDTVTLFGAPAGTYYVLIDTTAGSEGAYELRVTPAPGTMMMLGGGIVAFGRRTRRSV